MAATCECNPSFNCESKNEQILKSYCQNYIDQGKNWKKNSEKFYGSKDFWAESSAIFMFLAIEQEQSTTTSLERFSHRSRIIGGSTSQCDAWT